MTITIRPIEDAEGGVHFQELTRRVWGSEEVDVVPIHVTVTVLKNGGTLLGAYAPDGPAEMGGMVGAAFWWLGVGVDPAAPAGSPPRLKACSHMVGVLSEWQGRHVGLQLKLAQRQAVLAQGMTDWITWTYDPLYRANGVFNIHRLGATCKTYKRNIYGELRDALNAGVPSDRFQVDWHLNSPHVLVDINQARQERSWNTDGMQLLPVATRPDGFPQPLATMPAWDGRPLAIPLPGDISAIRRSDRDLSLAWRFYLREAVEAAFAGGYTVVDCVHLGEHGWRYILVREYM